MASEIWRSLDNTFTDVLEMTWPMILISVVLLSSIRLSYLLKSKKPFVLHKELLTLFFIIYILCLFQVVTFQDINSFGSNNFIPFREITRYTFGSRFCLVLIASLVIESTQLAIGRVFDVDDIILNVVGGMVGYFMYKFFNKLADTCPKIFKSQIFLDIITIICFIAFSAYILWR